MPLYAFKGKKPYKSWLKDGVNGGPCSMDVLVQWLSNPANYAKWRGDDYERIPKKTLLEYILDDMRKVGIYHRVAKDVASKISTLQSNYRLAREWKQVDGKKLREKGTSEQAIHDELVRRFPYWDTLDQVFHHKSATCPMSIRNITHSFEELDDRFQQTLSNCGNQDSFFVMESLLQVTREKEACRMRQSQEMLQFLREKRQEREQLLLEKELTKRVKAKAELVKNLMEAGFNKDDIAHQLNLL